MMQIVGELKKINSRKSASLDMVYQMVFETEDNQLMDLGKLSADTLVTLEIKPDGHDEAKKTN